MGAVALPCRSVLNFRWARCTSAFAAVGGSSPTLGSSVMPLQPCTSISTRTGDVTPSGWTARAAPRHTAQAIRRTYATEEQPQRTPAPTGRGATEVAHTCTDVG